MPDDLYAGDSPYQINRTPKRQYFSRADKSGTFSKDFLAFVMYHNGPMRAGILGSYGSYHIGPESQLVQYERSGILLLKFRSCPRTPSCFMAPHS